MPFDKDEVVRAVTDKGATKPCHRCGSPSFTVVGGYSKLVIVENLEVVIGPDAVPVALIACMQCGAITPHALEALGLLPDPEQGHTDGQ